MARVLLATCAEMPGGDRDEQLGLQAIRGAGIEAAPAAWDDRTVDWSGADLVVVRSTWDYPLRRAEFLAWARSVPRLTNPAELLAWNSDKTYLRQLADAGLPVVPTTWYAQGDMPMAPASEVVVKPTVSAGARDTRRHHDGETAREHVAALLDAGRAVMVQPYLSGVDIVGETGLVWMGDRFSHAFRKGALLRLGAAAVEGLFAVEDIAALEPGEAERALGERVLDTPRQRLARRVAEDAGPAELATRDHRVAQNRPPVRRVACVLAPLGSARACRRRRGACRTRAGQHRASSL